MGVASIDVVYKCGRETASVCDVTLSALGRKDFAVSGHLIGGRNLGSMDHDILDADTQFVLALGALSLVAVEIDL